MKKTVIDVQNMSFSFGSLSVLEDVTFSIKEREMIGVIGPNGGGKTTLLRLMLGLLKPDKGSITVLGNSPKNSSHRIGYVPQQRLFDPLFPVSVLDVVMMGRVGKSWGGPFSKNDRELAAQALRDVDLYHQHQTAFADLSGGQRQRTLIARALASSAELLFFDEPTANVDSFAEQNIYNLLSKLNEKLTIIVVSHDVGFVSKYVGSVVCVNRLVHIHPTSEIDGKNIQDIYGADLAMVRHDHRCSEKGHTWVNF
ncbi:MAG: ABC transporter ATP-binding protein [Proteobacteria bacterium]|nr:ABC transporter ATP-binding protein [Pseudomonadota bacterium]MBU4298208.1 ABC transporter ATP-binding protein [Pseudomonadota bacterium]MCG2748125.1 ABC transporter ATP-binding protein [Desulfobulbaceae bacterium]